MLRQIKHVLHSESYMTLKNTWKIHEKDTKIAQTFSSRE